jgi:hypothetical protein
MPPVHEKSTAEGEVAVFNYEELDQLSNLIRLLRILPPKTQSQKCLWDNSGEVQCELFHANPDDHPSYKALLYTWGGAFDRRHTIYLNGCCFEVRQNLWHALNRFQSDNVALVI